MGWFSRRPSTQQVVDARTAAADARDRIDYVDRSLRDHGRRMPNAEVQMLRVERFKAQQALRRADEVLRTGT